MATVLPNGRNYFASATGAPLVGGKLYTYIPGTSTPKATYTTSAASVANANPVILNSRGEATIYWVGAYDVVLKDASDVTIWGPERVEEPVTDAAFDAFVADLANSSDAAKGSNLVGLGLTLAYSANTVGAFARQLNPLRKYGALTNDGTTDDAATFQAAAASSDKFIDARGVNCRIGSAVNIPSGQVWLLAGATLTMASSTQTMWNADTVNDWALIGPFKITGDGSTVGTAKAIRVRDCSRWLVDAPNISSIKGWGFYLEPGGSTTTRASHGTLRDAVISSCYYGYEDLPGTGAEFCTIVNPRIYACVTHGLKTAAGNTIVLGGHIVDNTGIGVHLVNGSNHGHGIFSGVNINHNGTFGIQAVQVTNGFTFDGCHFYQNDLWFDRSAGIHVMGGVLDALVYNYKDGSSGMNVIDGCFCPNGYGIARMPGSNDGHDQLIIRNLWGPGSFAKAGGKDSTGFPLNDPALCYVRAEKAAGSTQSLTSGVAATLTYSTVNYLFDRRGAMNTGTGTFTTPTGQTGIYRIDLDLLFGGTAMSATASFVEVKVNGTTLKLFLPAIFGTTKLQIQGSADIYLNAADTVTVVATIVGTTPSFGDATWPSYVSIRRIT